MQFGLELLEFFSRLPGHHPSGAAFERAGHGCLHGADVERLGDVIRRPQPHGLAESLSRFVSGHHDHSNGWIDKTEALQDFNSRHPRHTNIQHGHVDRASLRQFDSCDAITGHENIVIAVENDPKGLTRAVLIVDDKKRRFGSRGR